MGWIRRRGNYWWIGFVKDHRRHEESSKSTRRSDAVRLLRVREGAAERGEVVIAPGKQLTFEQAAVALLNDYRINGRKSLAHAERRIRKHLAPWFGGWKLSRICSDDVTAFVVARQGAGASNAEINRELALLKRMFTLAHRAGKLLQKPHVAMLQEKNVRTGFFERDQFEAVCGNLSAPLRAVATFAYWTGWRIRSEVLPLQWRQVDWTAGTITLDAGTTKNGEARTFVFAGLDDLRRLLEQQRQHTDAVQRDGGVIVPFVFHRSGRPIRSLYAAWRAACRAAGCPGRIQHDFRRTAVRNLVRAGVAEAVAMKLTGHKTRSVFERYNIVSQQDLHEAARKLQDAFANPDVRETKASQPLEPVETAI